MDVVVLIEGLEDRSALLERASARDIDLSSQGVAVLPCNGKTKIGRPAVIFEQLGRSVYIMFDSDHDDESEAIINKRLLRLVNAEEEDWPSGVYDGHACFQENLTECIRASLGSEFYDETLRDACDKYGYHKQSRGAKNPTVMSSVFETAKQDDRSVSKIDDIIDQVLTMT